MKRTSLMGSLATIALMTVLIVPDQAHADANSTPIAVPLINADTAPSPGWPYPSNIVLSPLGGPLHGRPKFVRLHAVTHPCPDDLAVLLVHGLHKYLLLSNAGGCRPLQGTDLIFSSFSPALPDDDPSGVPHGASLPLRASSYGPQPVFPAPAPPGPYVVGLPGDAIPEEGTWSLYVMDRRAANRGVIGAGWSISYEEYHGAAFAQPSPVGIPDFGPASAYPLTYDFTLARDYPIHYLSVYLWLMHGYSDDLRLVLESPDGTKVALMANAGGNAVWPGTSLQFDEGAPLIPDSGPLTGGPTFAFSPGSVYETPIASLPAPAPPAPYGTSFGAFYGRPVTGIWKLWIYDDEAPDGGSVSAGTIVVSADLLGSPHPAIIAPTNAPTFTADQPFAPLLVEVTNVNRPVSGSWRNVVDGVYYDAGPLLTSPISGTTTYLGADVPLKKGTNVITVRALSARGAESLDIITITVNEFAYTLSEGATGGFFDEDVTLGNPAGVAAPVRVDFLQEGAAPVTHTDTVAGNGLLQLRVDDLVPDGAVSTVVHSTDGVPLAVERTMSWSSVGYGGHGGTALTPDVQWLFAEGSQGYFDTFLLLANDNATDVTATVRFLREGGGPVDHPVTVPARTRLTVYAGDIPALVDTSFGMQVTASAPITAERAMYFPHGGARTFEGGHEAAGVTSPSLRWLLAEGATGPFFDCFVLLSNPTSAVAHVTLTYLLPTGETIVQTTDVPANGRTTINVETVDARLANTPVSTVITSDRVIIAERSMYWPDASGGWREAHNTLGVMEPALRWGVSDIRVGGIRAHQTYVLLANPNTTPAEVEVRLLRLGGVPIVQTMTLTPTSRTNLFAADLAGADGTFSMDVRVLNYQPIVVEKAMYWNAGGEVWAAGTGVVATKLPSP